MIARGLLLAIAGCGLFAVVITAELGHTTLRAPERRAALRNDEPMPAASHPEPSDPGRLTAAILARPLFSPTRRPPESAQNPTTDFDINGSRLTGIVIEPGHRFAIFAVNGAKPLVLNEGEEFGGWRVETIEPHQISLSGPSGLKTLLPKLDVARAVPVSPPAPKTTSAPPPGPTPPKTTSAPVPSPPPPNPPSRAPTLQFRGPGRGGPEK